VAGLAQACVSGRCPFEQLITFNGQRARFHVGRMELLDVPDEDEPVISLTISGGQVDGRVIFKDCKGTFLCQDGAKVYEMDM
ncbi:MAG: hypothetical protein K0S07_1366, partial [Chlamydiales bacterium]|jgi:hypothetical protein|nr:hypothetical protein [Chlamydiales bacterium]